MRDADEMIERLLTGLRDAEPSAGIERRILEAMELREAAASDSHWRRLLLPWRLRPAMALVCVALAAILVASFFVAIRVHQPRHAPPHVSSHSISAEARPPEAVAQKALTAPRRMASRVSVRRPGDVSAVKETQAASYPAPPSPLTEQEKLLLRLAHRRDPQNMAILNRNVQATQSAKATEQFQQFFEMKPAEMRSEIE
jgi:hypothetical protein